MTEEMLKKYVKCIILLYIWYICLVIIPVSKQTEYRQSQINSLVFIVGKDERMSAKSHQQHKQNHQKWQFIETGEVQTLIGKENT